VKRLRLGARYVLGAMLWVMCAYGVLANEDILGGSTRRRMRPMISGSVVVGRRDPSHRTNLPRERLGPACLRLWRCPFSPSGDVFREEALLGQATVATRRGQSPTFTTSH
jgi:hypothetical protein